MRRSGNTLAVYVSMLFLLIAVGCDDSGDSNGPSGTCSFTSSSVVNWTKVTNTSTDAVCPDMSAQQFNDDQGEGDPADPDDDCPYTYSGCSVTFDCSDEDSGVTYRTTGSFTGSGSSITGTATVKLTGVVTATCSYNLEGTVQ